MRLKTDELIFLKSAICTAPFWGETKTYRIVDLDPNAQYIPIERVELGRRVGGFSDWDHFHRWLTHNHMKVLLHELPD